MKHWRAYPRPTEIPVVEVAFRRLHARDRPTPGLLRATKANTVCTYLTSRPPREVTAPRGEGNVACIRNWSECQEHGFQKQLFRFCSVSRTGAIFERSFS